jgi:hypothetical protein
MHIMGVHVCVHVNTKPVLLFSGGISARGIGALWSGYTYMFWLKHLSGNIIEDLGKSNGIVFAVRQE